MSANNDEAIANTAEGGGSVEFSSKVPASEPMMTGGHQPGKMVGNDAVPTFEAEILPAGSAPKESTFQPNPEEVVADTSAQPSAQDTIMGSTSGDVHTGLGHPGQGQSSYELRHDGQSRDSNPGASLQGVGATTSEFKNVDHRDPKFAHHRGIDKEDRVLGRGEIPSAEEREAQSADNVAAEHSGKSRQDRGTSN